MVRAVWLLALLRALSADAQGRSWLPAKITAITRGWAGKKQECSDVEHSRNIWRLTESARLCSVPF